MVSSSLHELTANFYQTVSVCKPTCVGIVRVLFLLISTGDFASQGPHWVQAAVGQCQALPAGSAHLQVFSCISWPGKPEWGFPGTCTQKQLGERNKSGFTLPVWGCHELYVLWPVAPKWANTPSLIQMWLLSLHYLASPAGLALIWSEGWVVFFLLFSFFSRNSDLKNPTDFAPTVLLGMGTGHRGGRCVGVWRVGVLCPAARLWGASAQGCFHDI